MILNYLPGKLWYLILIQYKIIPNYFPLTKEAKDELAAAE